MGSDVRRARLGTARAVLWSAIAVALLAPLVAMRVTDALAWTAFDFAAAAVLLLAGALSFEWIARWRAPTRLRSLAGAIVVVVILALWAQGAVGIV